MLLLDADGQRLKTVAEIPVRDAGIPLLDIGQQERVFRGGPGQGLRQVQPGEVLDHRLAEIESECLDTLAIRLPERRLRCADRSPPRIPDGRDRAARGSPSR